MYAPDGTRGYADPAHMADLVHAGYRVTPKSDFETQREPANQPGFLRSSLGVLKNQAEGALSAAAQPLLDAASVYSGERGRGKGVLRSGAEALFTAAADEPIRQTLSAVQQPRNFVQRGREGYGLPYRLVAPAAEQIGVNVPSMEHQADIGNTSGVIAEAAVPAAEVVGAEGAKGLLASRPIESLRAKMSGGLARPTLERTLAQTKTDVKFGHEPERAIVGEKITTAKQAEAKLDDLGKQIDRTLNDPKYAGKTINVRDVILRNARGAIADAKRAGNEGAANRIVQIRDAMLKHYGNLNKSPRAAAAMKTTIYGDIKWSGAEHEAEANAFRRSVAGGIRDAVNKAAPEVKELNKRYGDAAAARDELTRSEMLRSNRPMLTRLKEGAVAQSTRKVAQFIGTKYEKPPFGMTRGSAEGPPNGEGPSGGIQKPPRGGPSAPSGPRPRTLPPAGLPPAAERPILRASEGKLLPERSAVGNKPVARPLTERVARGEERRGEEGRPPAGEAERRLQARRAAVQQGASPLMRNAIVSEARKVVNDPTATAEDKRIAQERIDDIKAHPGEISEPVDINKVRAEQARIRKASPFGMTRARKSGTGD